MLFTKRGILIQRTTEHDLFSDLSKLLQKQVYAEKLFFLWVRGSYFHHLTPGCLETKFSMCQELSRSYQVTPRKFLEMS